ncbi:MAG TPA: DUF2784 family protein [Flavobacteriales bacterium]|nr:DUF2784 family protein [Flavobacteriales bacterium]HIN40633.1 DUF2784 family protein [Flavobacteriales bacterium]
MLILLDWFFLIFHTAIIIFNLFGWAWNKTRRANLFLLILTGCSWFILGIWYGIGYCPVTDWHYRVLKSLDNNNLPNSYVKYLIDRITGIDLDPTMVDIAVIIFFLLALCTSIYLNFFKSNHESTTTMS